MQLVVCLYRVTTNGLGNHILAHPQTGSGRRHRTELIDKLPDRNTRIICSEKLRDAIDLQSGVAKRLQSKSHLFKCLRIRDDPIVVFWSDTNRKRDEETLGRHAF